jgi:hypothetical protein
MSGVLSSVKAGLAARPQATPESILTRSRWGGGVGHDMNSLIETEAMRWGMLAAIRMATASKKGVFASGALLVATWLAVAACSRPSSPQPASTTISKAPAPVIDAGPWNCPVKARWSLRLRHDRPPYDAEWRQCAKAFHDMVGDWDIDALAVHDPVRGGALVWSTTNADELDAPNLRWLDEVEPTHFGSRGEEQLFVLTRLDGTGHAWELCVLGAVEKGVGCWAVPDRDLEASFKRLLSPGEWPHNCQVRLSPSGLAYRCGVARPGDANCCPTGGVLLASVRAADGHFVVDRVRRVATD